MNWKFHLSEYELKQIAELPPDIAALAEKYPSDIANVAEYWNEPPFPENYLPKTIEIYYGDTDSPSIFIMDGKLEDYETRLQENTSTIGVFIDAQCAYIQIDNREIFNRLGGVILPDIVVDPSKLIQSLLTGES